MVSPSNGAVVAAATLMLLLAFSPHARPRRVEMGYLYHDSPGTPELPHALLKKLQAAEASAGIGIEGSGASGEMMGGQRQGGSARFKQGRLQALATGNRLLSYRARVRVQVRSVCVRADSHSRGGGSALIRSRHTMSGPATQSPLQTRMVLGAGMRAVTGITLYHLDLRSGVRSVSCTNRLRVQHIRCRRIAGRAAGA